MGEVYIIIEVIRKRKGNLVIPYQEENGEEFGKTECKKNIKEREGDREKEKKSKKVKTKI